jgi:hypothetical protein
MKRVVLVVWLALLGLGVAHAEDGDRAARLAALRGEVDALSDAIELEKADMLGKMQALDASRSELELRLRQEELAARQLQVEIEQARLEATAEGAGMEVLLPSIRAGLHALAPVISGGVPYRVAERLSALEEIDAALTAGTLSPHRAASRLWQVYEDELRLGRENTVDRQTIVLGGDEILVDVARLGTVALFYRTPDGRVGWAERGSDGWTWREAPTRADARRVLQLFDSLQKQIRAGWFEIPAALPKVP